MLQEYINEYINVTRLKSNEITNEIAVCYYNKLLK